MDILRRIFEEEIYPDMRRKWKSTSEGWVTWDIFGTWVDAEGHISARVTADGRLIVAFVVSQRDRVRDGLKILEDLRDFIERELGIRGHIRYSRVRKLWELRYERTLYVYELCRACLFHGVLRLKHRKGQAEETVRFLEDEVRARYERMDELVRLGYDRVYKRLRTEYRKMLEEMERVKKKFPEKKKGRKR